MQKEYNLVRAQNRELEPEQLRHRCDPAQFTFQSTETLAPLGDMIGQDRARRAIEFGMDVPGKGFNVFALGMVGTGRSTLVRRLVEKKAATEPPPKDWVYVNNFLNETNPRAIGLPPGMGCELRRDMDRLSEDMGREIPRAFESEEYEQQRARIAQQLQERQTTLLGELEQRAKAKNLDIAQTPMGLMLVHTRGNKPISEQEFEGLPPEMKRQMEAAEAELQQEITATLHRVRQQQKEAQDTLGDLDRQVASYAIGHLIDDLQHKYADYPEVHEFLEQVRNDVIEHLDIFKPGAEQAPGPLGQMAAAEREAAANRYKVNLIVDSCQQKGAPVIIETNPTYYNLVGSVEQEAQFGALVTDFTKIRAGAFHRANGGYLILEARSVFTNPFAWDAIKRILKDGRIEIEEMGQQFRLFNTTTLEPQPIPADVKVVLIGEPWIYYLLHAYDEDFRRLFKVQADFGTDVDRGETTIQQYAHFVATLCREQGLRHFDPAGVARVVEHGSRLAEDQKKLATRFSEVGDLVTEASYWAGEAGHDLVTAEDVQKAIDEHIYRANRIEERIREMIERGKIMVDTKGAVVGQVNGLSVSMLGDYEFGRPSRITARTFVGRGNVVAIDREVEMAGPIHNKGVLTLAGYLGGRYAQGLPLSLSASLTFEQNYEEIEGDSASSAELYALLSSLADVPLKQNLAVTGSVNQRGELQPIGGVNAKIEGFFDVCKAMGLTGDQGVIIPSQNVDNLMLREDVIAAVKEGRFHIYPVHTIDEGLELLTGLEAGEMKDGRYPEGTVNDRVQRRLEELARVVQRYGGEVAEGEEEREPVHAGVRARRHARVGRHGPQVRRVRRYLQK